MANQSTPTSGLPRRAQFQVPRGTEGPVRTPQTSGPRPGPTAELYAAEARAAALAKEGAPFRAALDGLDRTWRKLSGEERRRLDWSRPELMHGAVGVRRT